jgi:hypothetical protein
MMRIDPYGVVQLLVQHFGWRFSVANPEGTELDIHPRAVTAEAIAAVLKAEYEREILGYLDRWRRRRLATYVGGPWNGEWHGKTWKFPGELMVLREGRAWWAVYEFGPDGCRAWFKGFATSYAKGRRRQLADASQRRRPA